MEKIKAKIIVCFTLVAVAFAAGLLLKGHFLEFYNRLDKQVKGLKKTDIGSVISEAGKQIFTPPPLKIQGDKKEASLLKSRLIAQTNTARQKNGNLPPLKENALLSQAALAKANDMFEKQYFEHISPSGIGPEKLVQGYGYEYITAGENLILGNFASEEEVVAEWMASTGHRENILNNKYSEIGAAIIKGVYKGQNVWIGVQEFGLPISACPAPDKILKNNIDSYKSQLEFLYSSLVEAKEEIESAGQNAPTYRQMVDNYNKLVEQYNKLAQDTKGIISNYNSQVEIFNSCVSE